MALCFKALDINKQFVEMDVQDRLSGFLERGWSLCKSSTKHLRVGFAVGSRRVSRIGLGPARRDWVRSI